MRFTRSFTLKDLSLERILENLDLFIYNRDRIPQRHIDFLHRLYSEECYKVYCEVQDNKNEEALLWFLSSHNRNVYLPYTTQNIVERLKIVGSGITSLTFQEITVSESVLNSVISCVPHLSYLDLSHTNCSDNTLLRIQRMCPDLVTLNASYCYHVTSKGMVNLCGGSMSLKDLNIRKTAVQLTGLRSILVGMPSLELVQYYNMAVAFYEIFCEADVEIGQKFNLTELIYEDAIDFVDSEDVIWIWTMLCPNVEKVHILIPVSNKAFMLCSEFENLKEFEYKSTRFGSYVCSPEKYTRLLCKLNNLTTLSLSTIKIPSVILFDCLSSVKDLYLNDVTFTDFNEDEIVSKTTNLNRLTIKNLDLDVTLATYKFIVLFISLSKSVTELVIHNNTFPCDLIDIILNSMKNLVIFKLNLVYTRLPSSLLKFFDAPMIQQICVEGCIDLDLCKSLKPLLSSKGSCTLAWRIPNYFMTEDDSDHYSEDDSYYSSEDDEDDIDCDSYDTDFYDTDVYDTEDTSDDEDDMDYYNYDTDFHYPEDTSDEDV